jgi:hypothetical protein
MSEAQAADQVGQVADHEDDAETVERARRMGWKGRESFTGDPAKFVTAGRFLAEGVQNPAVLLERYNTLDGRTARMERALDGTRQELQQALLTVREMTALTRTADQRAYERARREIMRQRETAVETGDTAAFKRLETEMDDLAKTAPPAAVAAPVQVQAPAPSDAASRPVPDEVQEFFTRNPWYTADTALRDAADTVFRGLGGFGKAGAELRSALSATEQRMRSLFPDKTGAPMAAASENAGGNGRSAPAVEPASGGAPRRTSTRWTFDTLPKESKVAFVRYKKMLAGKGEPLTEKEWAHTYYQQDQAYVDHLEAQEG